ncbi:MAG: hypothetical protein LH654_15230 [Thermoleophilia bacterium]|nr:hypothetical protein [Thermoleophilia bacterium]
MLGRYLHLTGGLITSLVTAASVGFSGSDSTRMNEDNRAAQLATHHQRHEAGMLKAERQFRRLIGYRDRMMAPSTLGTFLRSLTT